VSSWNSLYGLTPVLWSGRSAKLSDKKEVARASGP